MSRTTRGTLKGASPQRGLAISEGNHTLQLVPSKVNVGLHVDVQ